MYLEGDVPQRHRQGAQVVGYGNDVGAMVVCDEDRCVAEVPGISGDRGLAERWTGLGRDWLAAESVGDGAAQGVPQIRTTERAAKPHPGAGRLEYRQPHDADGWLGIRALRDSTERAEAVESVRGRQEPALRMAVIPYHPQPVVPRIGFLRCLRLGRQGP